MKGCATRYGAAFAFRRIRFDLDFIKDPRMDNPQTPTTLGLTPSFGFGDRIGLATPGHVAALKRAGGGIAPIFAQQSIREMTRTNRSARQVMEDAETGARTAGYEGLRGADADHLKTPEDVALMAEAGFTFFTLDPSAFVDPHADSYEEAALRSKYAEVRADISWFEGYLGRSVTLPNETVLNFDEATLMRCAVKYGTAIRHAIELAKRVKIECESRDGEFEIELSVDETERPTSLAEHFIIADQCLKAGMKLVSLAPRYLGDFEKGVDYKGDVAALERSLKDHGAVAEMLGPYKLSLHSGSDKLSMYPALARASQGRFHVKTAGTSYLEALRVVARSEERLFREIVGFARERYDTDKATYHVSATLDAAPPADSVSSATELERIYLGLWPETPSGEGFAQPGRQILHCTFGSTLTDEQLGPAIREVLLANPSLYEEALADHFEHHLRALSGG
jgi:hypothetical protein